MQNLKNMNAILSLGLGILVLFISKRHIRTSMSLLVKTPLSYCFRYYNYLPLRKKICSQIHKSTKQMKEVGAPTTIQEA